MPGSSTIAEPNTIINNNNGRVHFIIDYFGHNWAVIQPYNLIKETFTKHKRILFNGNNWLNSRKRSRERGLKA